MKFYHQSSNSYRSAIAITELALVLPFLAISLAICLDYGRVYRAGQILQEAANVGANYASGTVYQSSDLSKDEATKLQVKQSVKSLTSNLANDQITVKYTNNQVSVAVSYTVAMIFPITTNEATIRREATLPTAITPGQ